jgi:hypothetical protein
MATDQVTFFGEPLRKQIEVYFVSAGRELHVSVSYGAVGPVIDYNSQILLVQKLLSELARDPSGDKFKELGKPGRRSVPRTEIKSTNDGAAAARNQSFNAPVKKLRLPAVLPCSTAAPTSKRAQAERAAALAVL